MIWRNGIRIVVLFKFKPTEFDENCSDFDPELDLRWPQKWLIPNVIDVSVCQRYELLVKF